MICGFLGMRLSETSAARRNFPTYVNPALLLIPSAISVVRKLHSFLQKISHFQITFLYPLSLWTFRTLRTTIIILINENLQIRSVLGEKSNMKKKTISRLFPNDHVANNHNLGILPLLPLRILSRANVLPAKRRPVDAYFPQ